MGKEVTSTNSLEDIDSEGSQLALDDVYDRHSTVQNTENPILSEGLENKGDDGSIHSSTDNSVHTVTTGDV